MLIHSSINQPIYLEIKNLRVEVERLKETNAELEKKVNDSKNQIQTLEYINGEYAEQERKFVEKIETLENRLKLMEPVVVISPKFASPVISESSAIPVVPEYRAGSENSENTEDESTINYESAEDQLSPQKQRFRQVRDTKGKDKAVFDYESDSKDARAEMRVLMKTISPEY